MPGTDSESFTCRRRTGGGWKHQSKPQNERGERPEDPGPPPTPLHVLGEVVSPSTSGGKRHSDSGTRIEPSTPALSHQDQYYRPSVLRQATQASAKPTAGNDLENGSPTQPASACEAELQTDPVQCRRSSPVRALSPARSACRALPSPCGSLHQSFQGPWHHDDSTPPVPGGASGLYVGGLCRWPGCDASFEDFSSFLKHLYVEHGHSDKSMAQWRMQQDMVHYMERQAADWSYSLALLLAHPPVTDGNRVTHGVAKDPVDLAQQGYWPTGSVHLLPDLFPSLECYKFNNIRPPHTYAFLIRWSILESPDKQRTLNEIYTWFSTMFFYFRHNTATWKNAVRHNLSLHTCFVRVEGGKGAVWTVDEAEYKRRKGQKYYRDHSGRWLSPYSHFTPGES